MDSSEHKLKVLEISHVAPISPDLLPQTNLPFTFYDVSCMLRAPSQLVLFYDVPNIQTLHFLQSFLPRIKRSLSFNLQHFYPLAGNLTWTPESGKPTITYADGDSVQVIVSESINGDFNLLSSRDYVNPKQCCSLAPSLFSSTQQGRILAVQITLFPNCGICFGITTHHAVVDGPTAARFIRSWASRCRLETSNSSLHLGELDVDQSLMPFYDRSVIKDPHGLQELYLDSFRNFIRSKSMSEYDINNWLLLCNNNPYPENPVRAKFELSFGNVAKLKQYYLSILNNEEETASLVSQPTRFELACAFTWICSTKARLLYKQAGGSRENQVNIHDDDQTCIIFPVDYRARSDPPVPANYFGNCFVNVRVEGKTREIVGEKGLIIAVRSIRKDIKEMKDSIVKNAKLRISRMTTNGPDRSCALGGSNQLGIYKFDFGWGNPKTFEYVSIGISGAIFLSDSLHEGGMEINFVRSKEEIEAFAIAFHEGIANFALPK